MIRQSRKSMLIAMVGLGLSGSAFAQEAASDAPAVDPKAMDALARMGKALRAMGPFAVHADSTAELVLEDGEKVEFGGAVDYQVVPPNKLHASLKSDRREREYYFDGKTLTVYAPTSGFYATLPAPDTLRGLVDKAQGEYGLEMPLADLFLWGTDAAPTSDIKRATYVGPAFIDKTPVAHYAFREGDTDWQVWIDGEAMPRKLVITDTSTAERPEYTALLDWSPGEMVSNDAFAFKPSEDDFEIAFYPVGVAAAEEGRK